MVEKSKQSKRGGKRPNAGRKRTAQKAAELVAAGVLSAPPSDEPPAPKPKGRPTDFKPEYVAQAEKLCRLGATDIELADFFECDVRSIYRWAQTHDAFCQALKAGKDSCDDRVERSLYNRAIGYTHDAVKIFMPANAAAPVYAPYREHVPPDVGAASLWLRNRRADAWKDKREVAHSGRISRAEDLSDAELADIAAGSGEGTAPPESGPDGPDRVH